MKSELAWEYKVKTANGNLCLWIGNDEFSIVHESFALVLVI